MPRLPTPLLLKASRENPLLPLLLKECRSLASARNELRWFRERAVREAGDYRRQVQSQDRGILKRRCAGVPHSRHGAGRVRVQDRVRVQGRRSLDAEPVGGVGGRGGRGRRSQPSLRVRYRSMGFPTRRDPRTRLREMCESRARGMPLQYILGDQPFGELEILCRRGVLIPRADTEAYTYQAAKLVRQRLLQNQSQHQSQEQTPDPCTPQPHAAKNILQHDSSASSSPPPNSTSLFSPFHPKPIRILDLCTGTGCIALLLHALLKTPKPPHPQSPALQILGIDLSPTAVRLARRNLDHNVHVTRGVDACAKSEVHFRRGDVLKTQRSSVGEKHEDGDAVGEVDIPSVEQLLSYFDPEGEEIHRARNSAADADAHATDTKTYPPKKPPAGIQTKTKVAIEIDLLISNPPYISPSDFRNGTTARSVRLFEPRLALVPPVTIQDGRSPREPHKTRTEPRDSKCHSNGYPCARPHPNSPPHLNPEDIFYRRILHLSQKVKAGITVLECGDRMQAERVVRMFRRMNAMGMDMDVDMSEGSSSPSSSTSLGDAENNSPSHEVENQQPDEREPFTVEIWPSTDDDLRANGFHPTDGSRCVIIQRK